MIMNRLILLLSVFCLNACHFQGVTMPNKDYTQTHPVPKAFDSKRTQYTCATWTPPSPPDAEAHLWYRAATLLDAKDWRMNKEEFQDMIVLYEAAASKGHYQAIIKFWKFNSIDVVNPRFPKCSAMIPTALALLQ